jgi:hypothetical protein
MPILSRLLTSEHGEHPVQPILLDVSERLMIQRISAAEIFDRLRLGEHLGAIRAASGREKDFYNLTILPLG